MTGNPQPELDAPLYVRVCPGVPQRDEIIRLLGEGRNAVLDVDMDVLSVDHRGRALLWISDLIERRRSRVSVAQLTPAQLAEVIAVRASGRRPRLCVSYEILGERADGQFGALRASHVRAISDASAEPDLAELLGA